MRKLTLTQFMTLDGVVQSPGAPEEDPGGGFAKGGWLPPFANDPLFSKVMDARFAGCGSSGTQLVGSTLETLREIFGLPDALDAHPCECGHPEVRELPDGVFHCPACGAEVLPTQEPRPGSARFEAGGPSRFVSDGDRGAGRHGAEGA